MEQGAFFGFAVMKCLKAEKYNILILTNGPTEPDYTILNGVTRQ